MSSALAPNSIATAASAIRSPARGPMMCTPSTRSVFASARIFTRPSVVAQRARAAVGGNGKRALAIRRRSAAFSSSSVLPTEAISGLRVDHARDRVVVDVAVAGDDALDAGDAFLLGLVGEHRRRGSRRRSRRRRAPPCESGRRPGCGRAWHRARCRPLSRPSPSVFGSRPTASSTRSHSIGSAPSHSTTQPSPFAARPAVTRRRAELNALLLEHFWASAAISASMPGRMRSRYSSTVTLRAEPRQTEPSSSPM